MQNTYSKFSFYRPQNLGPRPPRQPRVIPYLSHGEGVKIGAKGWPVSNRQPQGGGNNNQQQQPQPPMMPQPQKPPSQEVANPYDYSSDPILQRVISGQDSLLSDAKEAMRAEQRRVLLGFGSKELARKVLGEDPFVDAISNDPRSSTSTLAQLAHQFQRQQEGFNEAANDQNLWYSGYRAEGLADLNRNQLFAESDAARQVGGTLEEILQRYLQAQSQSTAAKLSAEEAAYLRALDRAKTGTMDEPDVPAGDSAEDDRKKMLAFLGGLGNRVFAV